VYLGIARWAKTDKGIGTSVVVVTVIITAALSAWDNRTGMKHQVKTIQATVGDSLHKKIDKNIDSLHKENRC